MAREWAIVAALALVGLFVLLNSRFAAGDLFKGSGCRSGSGRRFRRKPCLPIRVLQGLKQTSDDLIVG